MPQIPTITAPELTPPPEMSPGMAGKPGQAMAEAGAQMASAADYGVQVADRIKKAQDEGILLNAENQIAADMEKAHAGLANWTDYTHADELKQQTAAALHEKYSEQYSNRPDLWRHISPYLDRELNSYDGIVDQKSAQLTAHFNKSALDDSMLRAENEAAMEPSIDGKERIWAVQDAKTDLMVKNGTLWADEGEVAKKLLRSRTIAAEVDRAANPLNPPSIMQDEMERLRQYESKGYVDPQTLEQLQYHLSLAYDRAVARSDKIDVSKQGDVVLSSVKNDPTLKDPATREFDPMAAAKKVDDDPSIPTSVKKYVRQELEEEAGATQKLQNDQDQKMLDDLEPKVESGQLTFAELTKRENLAPGQPNWIPRRVADHLLTRAAQIQRENRVENTQQRMLLRQEAAEASAEQMRFLMASPGYLTDESELYQGDNLKLSKADRATVWAAKNIKNVREYQDAYKIMASSSVYPQTDEGNAKLARDAATLRRTVDEKHLVGPQIIQAAYDIVHPQEETQNRETVKRILDSIPAFIKSVVGGQPFTPKVSTGSATQPSRPKGVPDNAVWNAEARQWQLPQ